MRIGIVGGTGKEGGSLAVRWARAGHAVTLGSRDEEKARARAATLTARGFGTIAGAHNRDAARNADVVVLTVPYAAHTSTLRTLRPELAGKVLLDVTVPLSPPEIGRVRLPNGRAAALEAQALLGPETSVVAALHHVSHTVLADPDAEVRCDVLVATDDEGARSRVLGLVRDLGLRALDAGPLDNAVALEALTAVLLHLNVRYGAKGAGVLFSGLPESG
ncbi:MAG: NADPH-dependent F420 reductase [Pseudomonadota bacterium]|nr:MAG: NADPH-dependent F420 reductase [Pseudomonadota bacterium]